MWPLNFNFKPNIRLIQEPPPLDWVGYFQAFGPVIIGIMVAGITFYWARRQNKVARLQLKESLYDRQFAVFEAANDFIRLGLYPDEFENSFSGVEQNLIQARHHAIFLFSDSTVPDFLQSLRTLMYKLHNLKGDIRDMKATDMPARDQLWVKTLNKLEKSHTNLSKKIGATWDTMDEIFEPFLKFPEKI